MREEGYFLSERIEAKPGDLIVFVWLVIESGVGTEGGVGKGVRSDGRLCDVTIRSVLPQSELPLWIIMDYRVPLGSQSIMTLVGRSIGH